MPPDTSPSTAAGRALSEWLATMRRKEYLGVPDPALILDIERQAKVDALRTLEELLAALDHWTEGGSLEWSSRSKMGRAVRAARAALLEPAKVDALRDAPPGTKLVLMSDELMDKLAEPREGYSVVWAWGEPDEHGWYTPTFTVTLLEPET